MVGSGSSNDVDGLTDERGKGRGTTEDKEWCDVGVRLEDLLESIAYTVGKEGKDS